jgi:hypothetical protein
MYLTASPEKGKTEEEKAEIEKKYKPGDDVLPKLDSKKKTLRERMVEDEDRALMNEVRDQSLREAGVESSEARRQRRRREDGRSHEHRALSSRDNSRENRESRATEDREERRRRREAEAERRRTRDDTVIQREAPPTEERRRRRSDGESSRRREEARQSTARQVEHQSSLRSLISSSDVDSREMEEEILRQIREEGLLDGIDLENIDVNQEDQISERIAEAFRRRQHERARHEHARRSDTGSTHSRTHSRTRVSPPASNSESRDTSTGTGRRRTHSRSPSGVSQSEEQSRPLPSMSAIQASHLEVQSSDEGRRRRRTTISSRNSAPVAVTETRAGTRLQTDLSDRTRSSRTSAHGPLAASNTRSSTDAIVRGSAELPSSDRPAQEPQPQTSNPASIASTAPPAQEDSETNTTNVPKARAAPPAELPLTAASTSFSEPLDRLLLPLPLSPRAPTQSTLADRANALSSGSRPTSSSSAVLRPRPEYFAEPSITCARCGKTHIEYELHYNCGICSNGNYNICLSCYRTGKGCLYWFGFGYTAFAKWENKILSRDLPSNAEKPHMLHASRYVPPKIVAGGAEGRRTLTTDDPQKRLQSGVFCAKCSAWTNECYWRCDVCNDGDWGFCNLCVNQGRSCTHPLLPLTYKPSDQHNPPLSPSHDQKAPPSASILTGPNVLNFGSFKPLTFLTTCDVCHHPIQPSSSRFHCFSCTSRVPDTQPGDYDICTSCYPKLVASRRVSTENGPNGWRRCLRGHRMIVVGFEDSRGGHRRVIVQDLVGGRGLIEEPDAPADQPGSDLMQWSWGNGIHISGDRSHKKLVTKDVMKSVPAGSSSVANESLFPPDGGVGMKAMAMWGWYPTEDADDELLFPKGAEIRECKDVNTDWYYGTYMGKSGLFQANYVRVLDTTVG